MIVLKDIAYQIKGRKILYDISHILKKGEITTLIGPNGAGKTTLLKIILGLVKPTTGSIEQSNKLRIGYMPQKITFNPFLPLRVIDFLKLNATEAVIDQWLTYFDDLPIHHLLTQSLVDLSGGEMQKILLLQAIIRNPDFLVLDEPAQGVDVMAQVALYTIIQKIREKTGCGILLVSHDLHVVMAQSDQVLCLNQHICCYGSPEDIQSHPEYVSLFGNTIAQHLAVYHHHHNHSHSHECELEKKKD